MILMMILADRCELCVRVWISLTLRALNYFCINHGDKRVFSI